jgi:hypothetical protein
MIDQQPPPYQQDGRPNMGWERYFAALKDANSEGFFEGWVWGFGIGALLGALVTSYLFQTGSLVVNI